MKKQYILAVGNIGSNFGQYKATNPITLQGLKRKVTQEKSHDEYWVRAYEVGYQLSEEQYPDEPYFLLLPVDGFDGDIGSIAQSQLMEAGYRLPNKYELKIRKIMEETGNDQKWVALKCGRDAAAVTRILKGIEPKTKSFQKRIEDLAEEVEMGIWRE